MADLCLGLDKGDHFELQTVHVGSTVVIGRQWGVREGESVTTLVQNRVVDLGGVGLSLNEVMDCFEMVGMLEQSGVWRRSFIQTPQHTSPLPGTWN